VQECCPLREAALTFRGRRVSVARCSRRLVSVARCSRLVSGGAAAETQHETADDVEGDMQRIHRVLGLALQIISWSDGCYCAAEDRACRIIMGLLTPCVNCEGTHWLAAVTKFLEANGACAQVASVVQRRGYAAQGTWKAETPRKKKRHRAGRLHGSGRNVTVTERRWLWLHVQLGGVLPAPGEPGTPNSLLDSADASPANDMHRGQKGEVSLAAHNGMEEAEVVFLVDGDNAANVFKHVDKFMRQMERCEAHAFVSRHFDGACPRSLTLHHAITGLPDAADHEISFFAGMYAHASFFYVLPASLVLCVPAIGFRSIACRRS